ncbi:acylneuraminate cytidylyltransferase family protein [Thalassospira sp. GB04J01]|uniref:acylneuraminate cytidylyltransferase family protein n=1 Tax=Thalassospira sp. GB04J01 TaxID=1485225 RepID=UPI000C9C6EFE|nr:acylneuraminate cytidylyltransferase family protein [Thalassospira sp. GB04J01]|tara:strand:+ start:114848 stop:115567 length:720 start_codon:yes stop_codon:yes gene_type:complete
MFGGKRILAVVPARGGSKGIPLKNLQLVRGVPLVALVGDVIKQVKLFDRSVVSTDHPDIAAVAEAAGIRVPFERPEHLSGDRIGDLDVLSHALHEMENQDSTTYDVIVMLQPTSPLRTASNVIDCIEKLVLEKRDAVWTVSETDSKEHPLKQLTLGENGALEYYDPKGEDIIARQQLQPVYHRNGIAYAITRDCLLNQLAIKGSNTAGLVVKGNHVSIDTKWDLELVEFILSRYDEARG